MKEWKFFVLLALLIIGFIAYREYNEIRNRFEITQSKIDAVADESARAIRDFNSAIAALRKQFLRLEELDQEFLARLDQLNQPKQEPSVESAEPTVSDKSQEQIKRQESGEAEAAKPAETVPTITMYTDGNCGACNTWWTHERGKWTSQGWTVDKGTDISGNRLLPWFKVTERSGKTFEVDGPLTSESFLEAQKIVAALNPAKLDDLGTQYKQGYYNGTYDFANIDHALNLFGRYWNVRFQRVSRGGQFHVVQSNKLPKDPNVAAWLVDGNTAYINPQYNFQRLRTLSGMVICHELGHARRSAHHAQDGGLMGPQGGYLLLPTDYPYFAHWQWNGKLRPTDEPGFMHQYLSGGKYSSTEGSGDDMSPLLKCEHN